MIVGIIIGILISALSFETYIILKPKEKVKKEAKVKLSKEDKEKQNKIQRAFNDLMNYDYTVASKRRDS